MKAPTFLSPGLLNYLNLYPEQLGYLLRERRKEVFLVTKCWEPHGNDALKLLQRNLRELQTDYADLVFVHSVGADKMDPKIVFGRRGCYPALMKAKANGLAKYVGFSGHNRQGRFVDAIKNFKVDALLNAVNFVDHHTYNFEQEVWPLANKSPKTGVPTSDRSSERTTPYIFSTMALISSLLKARQVLVLMNPFDPAFRSKVVSAWSFSASAMQNTS